MKRFMSTLLLLLAGASLLAANIAIRVTAPVNNRERRVVALDWKTLVRQNKRLSPKNARVRDAGGKVILSQPVDNDGDGEIDELLFLAEPGSQGGDYKVLANASLKMPEAKVRAFARYVPERKDDFAWENDLVAFRAYGPALREGAENCGFDCFMKRVEYPIIDKWYSLEQQGRGYHLDYGEGYDGYKVGASLGCGGSAVWRDGQMFRSEVYAGQRVLSRGPLRAVFELSYGPWEVAGKQVTEKKIISIEPGKRMFRVDDRFFADGKPAEMEIVIGVTTHGGKAEARGNPEKGYLYAWEKIDDSHLGTAVVVPRESIKEYKLIDSRNPDQGHALFVASTSGDGRITYYAGYGWEKAGGISSREQWEQYLEQFVRELKAPAAARMK